jgi:hypothetical protein
MIVLIDWLIEQASTHSCHLLWVFSNFPIWRSTTKLPGTKKTWAKDWLPTTTKSRSFLACFLSCHDMRKQTRERTSEERNLSFMQAAAWGGGRGGPSSMQKQREFCQHNFWLHFCKVSLLSLSLSLSPQLILQADLVLGLFFFYLWPPSKVGWCAF